MNLLSWIVVGSIAGWATGRLMRGSGYGVIADIFLGSAGSVVGGLTMRSLGFSGQSGLVYSILVAMEEAVVLTAIVRLKSRHRTRISVKSTSAHDRKKYLRRAA